MPYDPNFIPGVVVDLPGLADHVKAAALNNGTPVDHSRFSIVFNQERGFAILTAHNIDGENLIAEGVIPRRDRFRNDPLVSNSIQVDNDRGYVHNPWDRGHLVRRRAMHWGNQTDAETADRESYFWTNIVPQHEKLHDSAWGDIEDWMLDVTQGQDKKACVFTGPVLTPGDPQHVNRPGEAPIQIPAGFWKVFVVNHQGQLRAAGFVVWQRDFDQEEPVTFDPVLEQVRLTTIEYLTGLSFASIRAADPLRFGAVPAVAPAGVPTVPGVAAAPAAPRAAPAIARPTDIVL
ncbi:MAG: DNA/RNA non-specific endonuclease [Saprospiraceae bacterium]|nr:DNA/RNA non-specific endonuclease [Saprospiraceae bacterium]